MKKNTNSKSNKDYKNILSPLSKKQKITFSHNLFKEVEANKIGLSHKKSQDELLLNKKINNSNKNHRRIKSNSCNYIESMTNFEKNFGLNTTMNQLSFFKGKKKKEKGTKNEINSKNSISRNKKIEKNKDNNLFPLSCSLKDFRNGIIKEKKNENDIKKYYNKEIYLNKNNLIINNDIITNIEETRNTTSINNINNNNLIYSKHINESEKEDENKKNKKYIKICRKANSKLYSPVGNNPKINYTNANNNIIVEKPYQKYNLHRFIYNNNNLKTKDNNNNKSNKNNISGINYNSNYLNTTKKSFRNSAKFSNLKNYKNLSIICPTSDSRYEEPLSFYNSNKNMNIPLIPLKEEKHFSKNNFPSSTTNKNKNKEIKFTFTKFKKRSNKSQENIYKSKIYESDALNEFDSVEEIHFMFVEMNQRKKKFFKNYEDIYEK